MINTVYLFFQNLIYLAAFLFATLFSLVIKDRDYLSASDNLVFSQMIQRSLILLFLLIGIYFIGSEFINPLLYNQLETGRKNAAISKILKQEGNHYFQKSDFELSRLYYEQYLNLMPQDVEVKDRLRQLRLKVRLMEDTEESYNNNFPVNTDYIELAGYYDQKGEYITAWYYYQYVVENDSVRRSFAIKRIEEIKNILAYRNSLKNNQEKMAWLNSTEQLIRNIHQLRVDADQYVQTKQYHEAYYTFSKIMKLDKNIKDAAIGYEKMHFQLKKIGVEMKNIVSSQVFSGKKDFVFYLDNKTMLYFADIKKILDIETVTQTYYVKDISIYFFDENKRIEKIVYAPYGQFKNNFMLTLYTLSLTDQEIEYLPLLKQCNKNDFDENVLAYLNKQDQMKLVEFYENDQNYYYLKSNVSKKDLMVVGKYFQKAKYNFFNQIPTMINQIDFVNLVFNQEGNTVENILNQNSILSNSEVNLLKSNYTMQKNGQYLLNHEIDEKTREKIWKIFQKSELNIFPHILNFNINIDLLYNFSYNYQKALNFPLNRLFSLRNLSGYQINNDLNEMDFSYGFNNNFIKTAIMDKISLIFIFFYMNIFFIAFSWRNKAHFQKNIPFLYQLFYPIILLFVFLIITGIKYYNTTFYSILSYSLDFWILLITCIVINLLLSIAAILYLSSTKIKNI
ncbi:MAG: hypothetical protein MJB14_05965 [Spirochaetes bacterium]|nr:hypothetical protein [Spirochaetota bacterium]